MNRWKKHLHFVHLLRMYTLLPSGASQSWLLGPSSFSTSWPRWSCSPVAARRPPSCHSNTTCSVFYLPHAQMQQRQLIVLHLSVFRLTVVLCKEISLLSKKFTSCLTTAGVSKLMPYPLTWGDFRVSYEFCCHFFWIIKMHVIDII